MSEGIAQSCWSERRSLRGPKRITLGFRRRSKDLLFHFPQTGGDRESSKKNEEGDRSCARASAAAAASVHTRAEFRGIR
jgi:hypothetical protein